MVKTGEIWGNTNKKGIMRALKCARLEAFSQYTFCMKYVICTFNCGSFVLITPPSFLLDF